MFRRTEPAERGVGLYFRKRRCSDATPPITKFFPTVKRSLFRAESKNLGNVEEEKTKTEIAQLQPDLKIDKNDAEQQEVPRSEKLHSLMKLRLLLGVQESSAAATPDQNQKQLVGLDNLPENVYSHIFSVLDTRSVSALSLVSTTMSSHVKYYVSSRSFFNNFHLENLEFLNSSFRQDDEEFFENDPFLACGELVKSITILMNSETRAEVFLIMCQNLRDEVGGSLNEFGRILEVVTYNWKFSERKLMLEKALMIDEDLIGDMRLVLTSKSGELPHLEKKIRSGLTQLFLNRNQEVYESSPHEIITFGSWLSILMQYFNEAYEGKLYYILFGPTRSCRRGEQVDWLYFCDDSSPSYGLRRNEPNYKKRMMMLVSGMRALRIMNNSKNSDQVWSNTKIYHLYLRVIEACEEIGYWANKSSSMALAIDCSGLFAEYLITCLDRPELMSEAAEMVCRVRNHLYRWSATPATFLSEPLHRAFNHLAHVEGHYEGGYKNFLDKIWRFQRTHLKKLVQNAGKKADSSEKIREELDGQLSMIELLNEFSETIARHQRRPDEDAMPEHQHPIEQDEQLE